jgi:hypothetical protein
MKQGLSLLAVGHASSLLLAITCFSCPRRTEGMATVDKIKVWPR